VVTRLPLSKGAADKTSTARNGQKNVPSNELSRAFSTAQSCPEEGGKVAFISSQTLVGAAIALYHLRWGQFTPSFRLPRAAGERGRAEASPSISLCSSSLHSPFKPSLGMRFSFPRTLCRGVINRMAAIIKEASCLNGDDIRRSRPISRKVADIANLCGQAGRCKLPTHATKCDHHFVLTITEKKRRLADDY